MFKKILILTVMASMPFVAFSQAIEEVTVTATRKAESLQDIPLSVQAIDSDALEGSHIETSTDLARLVPGFSFFSSTGTGSQARMRGLVMPAITAASQDAQQMMINGHSIPNTTFGEMGFFDTERLEILNGPQGTLYGRNAITGLINLITKRPGAGDYLNLTAGDNGYGLIKAGFDFSISDNLFGRLAVNSLTIDSNVQNTALNTGIDNRRNTSFRLSLDYDFDDGSQIQFNTDMITIDDNRLNLGAISCNRDAFFGCSSLNTDISEHINRPAFESGSIQAVLQKVTMLRTNIPDDNLASTDANRSTDIDSVTLNFDPIRRQDSTFHQFQYLRDLDSPIGDIAMKVIVSDRKRNFFLSDDNDHTYHTTPISNFYTSSTFSDVNGVNMLAGSDGVYDIESHGTYCVGSQSNAVYTTSSECAIAITDEQQYELNFVSDFDGPFNFVAGIYGYDSEAQNQNVVQNTAFVMSTDFALNPVSQIFAGGQDSKAGFVHAGIVDAVLNSSIAQGGATAAVNQVGNSSAALMLGAVQTALASTLNPLVNGLCTRDSAGEASILASGATNPDYGASGTITGIDICTKKSPLEIAGNMIDSRTNRSSKAFYGEITYDVNDSTQLNFGARYMDDRMTNTVLSTLMDLSYAPSAANATNATAVAACKSASRYEECFNFAATTTATKDEVATYKFGIKHEYETVLGEGMVFASYTEGNRPGGANAQTGSLYKATETESIQIGTKNVLFDGALQLNVTAFADKHKAAQMSEIYVTGSNVLPLDYSHNGLEIQSSLFVTESTILRFSALITDSEVDVFSGENVIGPLGNVIASGSTILDPHNPTAATSFGNSMDVVGFSTALQTTYGFDAAMATGIGLAAAPSGPLATAFNGIVPTAVATAQAVLAGAGFPDVTGDQLYIVDGNGNVLVNALGLVLDTGLQIETGGKVTYRTQNLHSSGATIANVLNNVCAGARAMQTTTATCAALSTSASVMQQVGGNKIQGVSDYEYSIGITQFYEAFNGAGSINISYTDDDGAYGDAWNNQRYFIDGTSDISANITFVPNNGDWTYNFWVRNLADNRDITSVNRTSNLQGAASFVTFTEGRKIGIDLKREF